MNLSIKTLSDEAEIIEDVFSYWGEINIGNYTEKFEMNGEWWNLDDYKKQWQQGLERLKYNDTSCLVITVKFEPNLCIMMWTLYKNLNLNKIFVQQQLLTYSILENLIENQKLSNYKSSEVFDINTCYEYIAERGLSTEVSEWEVNYE